MGIIFKSFSLVLSLSKQSQQTNDRKLEGRKEMFYLMMHSSDFIYNYMVKDHSDSERGNPLCHYMGLPFQLAARDLLVLLTRSKMVMELITKNGLLKTKSLSS